MIKPRAALPIMPTRPENAAEMPTARPHFLWNQLESRIGAGMKQRNAEAIPWISPTAYQCHSSCAMPMRTAHPPITAAAAVMTARTGYLPSHFAANGIARARLTE